MASNYRILQSGGAYFPQQKKQFLFWSWWVDLKITGLDQPGYTTEDGARVRFEIMKANQLIPKGTTIEVVKE